MQLLFAVTFRIFRLLSFSLLILCVCALGVGRFVLAGDQLAYESDRDGDEDIYLLDLRTRIEINLTRDNLYGDYSPTWSPNGAEIAFESLRTWKYTNEIYILSLGDSSLRQLTLDGSNSFMPSWSPLGDQLSFVLGNGLLRVINSDGEAEHNIGRGYNPSWSPDGVWVVFDPQYQNRLSVVRPESESRLESETEQDWLNDALSPVWSPDGERIAYYSSSPTDLSYGIYVVEAACLLSEANCTDTIKRLTPNRLGDSFQPAWSADGSRIAYVCADVEGHREICMMNADGSRREQLTHTPSHTSNESPAWRP
jgi:Tol biopolymer transport system component